MKTIKGIAGALLLFAALVAPAYADAPVAQGPAGMTQTSLQSLADDLAIGDLIFIRVSAKPFREVAAVTNSWTNHVGVVVSVTGREPLVGESTVPLSRTTTLSKFVRRSERRRLAVARLSTTLTQEQQQRVVDAAKRRYGVFYDTGFDLHSRRQFCSRFVREVLAEATGITLGEVETFQSLFARNPQANLKFWKAWYFGRIPWSRETVTPASLLRSPQLEVVFDGTAADEAKHSRMQLTK